MQDAEIKNIHVLQSKNVRYLKKIQKSLTMDINKCLIKNDLFQLNIKTKYYALLYSSVSESQFLQILYTPYGFRHSEILEIKKQRSIVDSWNLMIDISIKKVGKHESNSDLKKKKDKIKKIIDEYIKKPQELRNKIAHGQWVHALNSENTKENLETTKRINDLDVVQISIWFEVHQYLCFIIRDLIQSPKKGFHNNYWSNLVKLDEFLSESKKWTIEKRVALLNVRKPKNISVA